MRALVRGGRLARVVFDRMPGTPWEIPGAELARVDVRGEPERSTRTPSRREGADRSVPQRRALPEQEPAAAEQQEETEEETEEQAEAEREQAKAEREEAEAEREEAEAEREEAEAEREEAEAEQEPAAAEQQEETEAEREEAEAEREPAVRSPVTTALPPPDLRQARQALEALRLGVVPAHHLETYTVGRDDELDRLRAELDTARAAAGGAGAGGLRVLLGDYGTGKTHTLGLAARLALEQGYLVGWATLDSRENLPSHPRRIYHQLARGLRYPEAPDAPAGLAPLLTRAARDADRVLRWAGRGEAYARGSRRGGGPEESGGRGRGEGPEAVALDAPADHPYLGPALLYHAALAGEQGAPERALHARLLDWIEGAEVASNQELMRELRGTTGLRARLWALRDHRTVTHLYTLLLGGIATLAREVGYAGLLCLVDEAEFYSVLRGQDRGHARVLFQTLAAAALPPSALRFDPEGLPRGGQAAHRRLPHRFSSHQPLQVVLALTHDPEGRDLLEGIVTADRFLELRPFDTEAFVALSQRVLALYERAGVPLAPGAGLAPLLARVMEACHRRGLIENPRQALKFVTELVDVARLRPERVKPLLVELKERFLRGAGPSTD